MDEANQSMQKTLDHYQEELKNLRTSRPSSTMLYGVSIDVYGTEMRMKELATVSVADGNQLVISPFDPNNANAIAKGIKRANLGLLPSVDGTIIRVPIPPMSEERRHEIAKDGKEKGEKAKVTIREHRRKANDLIKKQKSDGDISEDEQKKKKKKKKKSTLR
eukprot:Platyproteum_vivax@DN15949_c0_g1_i1.p1